MVFNSLRKGRKNSVLRIMDRFHLFEKRSFRYENDDEKVKTEWSSFENDRKTIV